MSDSGNFQEEYLAQCREALDLEQSRSLGDTDNWAHVDRKEVKKDWKVLYKEFAKLIDKTNPEDSDIQKLVFRHFEIASRFYLPSKEAYIGMTVYYNENKQFQEFHNTYHPNMVDFLTQAIRHFAEVNL